MSSKSNNDDKDNWEAPRGVPSRVENARKGEQKYWLMLRGQPWAPLGKGQVLMTNNLKMPAHKASEVSFEVRAIRREASPRGGSKGKQALSYYNEAESQGDSQTVVLGRRKVPPSRVDSSVDLRHALNTKQSRGKGDLQAILVAKAMAAVRSILPAKSEAMTPRSAQMEKLLLRYQTPFTPKINAGEIQPPKFTMYNGYFPRAQFVINTKALEGMSSLLTLQKGKNETLRNYSKRYWEIYNEIEGCSEDLTAVSYKIGLTPSEKLYGRPDLVERVERTSSRERAHSNGARRARKSAKNGLGREFQESIYKLLAKFRDKPYYKKPFQMEEDPKKRNQQWKKDADNALEQDLPIRIIHMIGVPHDPELENRIWREIRIVKQMNKVFSVRPTAKNPRQESFEPGASPSPRQISHESSTPTMIPWSFSCMSSTEEAEHGIAATANTLRTEDEAMESDADVMSELGINISDDDQVTTPKSRGRPTSKKACRDALARMCLMDELPFQFVEREGEAIGKALEACMVEWDLGKVCTITVDNASDVAISYLKKKLAKKNGALILGGDFLHMRCCAHIINLIEFTSKRATFQGMCSERGNNLQKLAFERLEEEDPLFLVELHMGWDDARMFSEFLEKFYNATLHLSGSSYTTSNMYFSEVIAIEGFLSDFLKDVDLMYESDERVGSRETLVGTARKMKKKFDKYWELTNMVRDVMNRAFVEYEKFNIAAPFSTQSSSVMEVDQLRSGGSERGVSFESKFEKHLEKEDGGKKSEIDRYLEERCEKKTPSFEILKLNSSKYPILSEIVRDVLAIPVSTVASKAAFSTGGRVVDQFRSSLSPKLVECLICMQDWLRATPLPFEVEEDMEQMQDLELVKQCYLATESTKASMKEVQFVEEEREVLKRQKRERTELIEFLKANIEVFEWRPYECQGSIQTSSGSLRTTLWRQIVGAPSSNTRILVVVMQKDAQMYVRKCMTCQLFSPLIHQPARDLTPLTSLWPFTQWGRDIVGVLPRASKNKFFLVATNYFTKWVETELQAQIREVDVIKFIRNHILSRFGISKAFGSDNGTKFMEKVNELLDKLKIEFYNSTPSYPQCNRNITDIGSCPANCLQLDLPPSRSSFPSPPTPRPQSCPLAHYPPLPGSVEILQARQPTLLEGDSSILGYVTNIEVISRVPAAIVDALETEPSSCRSPTISPSSYSAPLRWQRAPHPSSLTHPSGRQAAGHHPILLLELGNHPGQHRGLRNDEVGLKILRCVVVPPATAELPDCQLWVSKLVMQAGMDGESEAELAPVPRHFSGGINFLALPLILLFLLLGGGIGAPNLGERPQPIITGLKLPVFQGPNELIQVEVLVWVLGYQTRPRSEVENGSPSLRIGASTVSTVLTKFIDTCMKVRPQRAILQHWIDRESKSRLVNHPSADWDVVTMSSHRSSYLIRIGYLSLNVVRDLVIPHKSCEDNIVTPLICFRCGTRAACVKSFYRTA
ncbi:hypothetical protein Acr_00g0100220 [Actinidia rufa]|uniref:Integrase catalytic domain-containing protein n=1 Tax=Actinidia rufa TaxID=165716 RepID=A0A7J0E257_9ERIC|nr:hypothetical protein Acr_00g0100220 [Actinidia rufa]